MAKKNACLYHYYKKWKEWPTNDSPHPDKDKILNYLYSGALYAQTSYRNPDTGEREGVSILTDGEWEWDCLLRLLVECKNFKIDDAFLQHMKDNNWEIAVPMNTFRLTLFDSHAIIGDSKNTILIDTGAPSTIHSADSLFFCDENYSCSTNYAGTTLDKLSELLGMKITTLLGVDILSNYNVLLDYKNSIVQFYRHDIKFYGKEFCLSFFNSVAPSVEWDIPFDGKTFDLSSLEFPIVERDMPFDGKEYNLSSINGIPIIELEIEGQTIKLFLDTGAKISYLPKEYTSNFETIGIEPDFHPSFGKFETECFNIPAKFEGEQLQIKFGNLPEQLQKTLSVLGINGVVGYDFFNHFKVILDLKNNKLKYAKH